MSDKEQTFEEAFDELVDETHEEPDSLENEVFDDGEEGDTVENADTAHAAPLPDEDAAFDEGSDSQAASVSDQPRDEHGRFVSQSSGQDEIEQYKAEIQKWQHKYNSDLGRQNALQRKISELQEELAQAQKQPVSDNPEGSGVTDAEWETIKEDFPEIASGFDARLRSVTSSYEQQLRELREAINPIREQQAAAARNTQLEQLAQQHPDWQDVARSNEFRSWVSQQPPAVQELVQSENAADAATLLNYYKSATGQQTYAPNDELKQRRERQLRQGQTISNRGGRSKGNLPPADDFEAAFNYFAERG